MRSAAAALVAVFVLAGAASANAETINVNTTSDGAAVNPAVSCMDSSGDCTLRGAVQRSNSVGGSNTINLPAGTYKLTLAPDQTDADNTGDLNVTNASTLTITGAGSGTTTIDANFIDRAFTIESDSTLNLSGVTVTNGRPGTLGNVTTCPSDQELPGPQDGGAILQNGSLTLINDVINNNMAPGPGGAIASQGGPLSITGTTISANTTCNNLNFFTDGGAIMENSGSSVHIDSSTISGNTVNADGSGGGFAEEGGSSDVSITNSTISGNTARFGGGIDGAGGEGPGQMTLRGDTLSGNTAAASQAGLIAPGGAIDNLDENLSVVNSTVTGNTATNGGGIAESHSVTISFSTIDNNTATGGGNGTPAGNLEASAIDQYTVDNSIVANGHAPTAANDNCGGFGFGTPFTSNGHNVFDDSGTNCAAVSSDIVNQSPGLGPLQNNGGPTQTQAIGLSSPAFNKADNSLCASEAISVDQRGIARPQGPQCDIGAFELQYADLQVTTGASPSTIYVGQETTVTDTVTNAGPATAKAVTLSDPAPAGLTIESVNTAQGSCTHTSTTVSCSLGDLPVGASVKLTILERYSSAGAKTSSVSVTDLLADPVLPNNSAATTITVLPLADLALTKTASHGHVVEGANDTFILTVTNKGPSTGTGVKLTDNLPSGLSFVSAKASQGSCSGTGPVTCQLGTLNSGHKATVTIVARPTHTGKIRNTAHVTGTVRDPNPKNNSASASITVKSACHENLVFRTNFMPVDKIPTAKVYVDGRLTQTLHGSNLRVVTIKPVPATGVHSVTVMFIIAPLETVTATRTYTNCGSGPTHYAFPPQTNPGAS